MAAAAALPSSSGDTAIGIADTKSHATSGAKGYNQIVLRGLPKEYVFVALYPEAKVHLVSASDAHITFVPEASDRILILGSYIKGAELAAWQLEHKLSPDSCTILVNSNVDLEGYTKAGVMGVTRFALPASSPPWMLHFVRRTSGKSGGEIPDDEYFYRGAMDIGSDRKLDVSSIVHALMHDALGTHEELISRGKLIVDTQNKTAREQVKFSGRVFKWTHRTKESTVCVVYGGVTPIMPLAMAAAEVADIGVHARYNAKTDETAVTAYTFSPERTDLAFMNEAPWNGGGECECKGTTLRGFVNVLNLFAGVAL